MKQTGVILAAVVRNNDFPVFIELRRRTELTGKRLKRISDWIDVRNDVQEYKIGKSLMRGMTLSMNCKKEPNRK